MLDLAKESGATSFRSVEEEVVGAAGDGQCGDPGGIHQLPLERDKVLGA